MRVVIVRIVTAVVMLCAGVADGRLRTTTVAAEA
jgi:hypothetical protein